MLESKAEEQLASLADLAVCKVDATYQSRSRRSLARELAA